MHGKSKDIRNLNRAMEEAVLIVSNKKNGNEYIAYRKFYNALCNASRYKKLIDKYNFSLEEMIDISKHLQEYGYSWNKYVYIPIHAFYREKVLIFMLENSEELRGLKGKEIFSETALKKKFFRETIAGALFKY